MLPISSEKIAELIEDKIPETSISVREDFESDCVVVEVCFSRYVAVHLSRDALFAGGNGIAIDGICRAAEQAMKRLRSDIERLIR